MQLKNLLGILLLISLLFITPAASEQYYPSISVDIITEVTEINGNTQLANNSTSGDGSAGDPYILEFNINGNGTSDDLVTIIGTTYYFIIQNSDLHGGGYGIVFNNVIHGTIDNTDVYENDKGGILFTESNNNTIVGSSIHSNVEIGITFTSSSYNTVEDSFIYNHTNILSSLLDLNHHTGGSGVVFDPSDYNVFKGNTIYENNEYGIHGLESINATIEENTIYNNNIGVKLTGMSNSKISSNNIYDHIEYGISIENSDNIVILSNTFSNNAEGNLFIDNPDQFTVNIDTDITTTITIDPDITLDDSPYPEITFIISLILIPICKKKFKR